MDVAKFRACFWRLRWKIFQYREEQPSPTKWVASQRYKASTSVAALCESDAYPEQFWSEQFCRMFLQNLPREREGWRFERAMAWFVIEKG